MGKAPLDPFDLSLKTSHSEVCASGYVMFETPLSQEKKYLSSSIHTYLHVLSVSHNNVADKCEFLLVLEVR